MKLVSWNVNGIRAVLKKGFMKFMENEDPDIFCMQETKAKNHQVQINLLQYHQFWSDAEKSGYAGTAVFTKVKPVQVIYGINKPEHDKEGRVITLEFAHFFVVNVYTPNAQRGLTRLKYRMQWDKDFLSFVKDLDKKKPVIVCGDLNVAHEEIDLANPKANRKNAGFTDDERANFSTMLGAGFIDTFRELHKEPHQYTWWTYRFNARKRNVGWRIDYWCVSKRLKSAVKDAFIRSKVMGSDHCPVGMVLDV